MLAAKLGLLASLLAAGDEVELKAADGCVIAATWTKPGQAGRRPALLLVHGSGGRKEDWVTFAAVAAKAGYAVLAIDLRGHGKSSNPEGKIPEKREREDWMKSLADLNAAKSFLEGRAEVDAKRIVVVGAHIGANLALHLAAEDAGVRAVAVLSPGDSYKGVSALDPMEKYGNRPFFAAAGADDAYAAGSLRHLMARARHPLKHSRELEGGAVGPKLFEAADKDGGLTGDLLDWLKAATR